MEIARVQKSLATKALSQPTHRFDDLYRYVRDVNWLESARSAILSNNGANTPGVDGINGQELPVSEWLALLNQTIEELREGTYRPMPVRRIYIPKANGKLRPLGIPMLRSYCPPYRVLSGFVAKVGSDLPTHSPSTVPYFADTDECLAVSNVAERACVALR